MANKEPVEEAATNATPAFAQLWAKSGDRGGCHRLAHHALDVGACARALLEVDRGLLNSIGEDIGLPAEPALDLVAWLASLHDIGKAAPGFQQLVPEVVRSLGREPIRARPVPRHDVVGLALLMGPIRADVLGEEHPYDPTAELPVWNAVAGHHGVPADRTEYSALLEGLETGARSCPMGRGAIADAVALARGLAAAIGLAPEVPPIPEPARLSWRLAGLLVVADWLGSDEDFFPWPNEWVPLQHYWSDRALPKARSAVRSVGLEAAAWSRRPSFATVSDFAPRPLQSLVDRIELPNGPCLVCIEDTTGSGKTEAALTVALKIAERDGLQRIYVGLPTMATANGLFARVRAFAERAVGDAGVAMLSLAHARAQDHAEFSALVRGAEAAVLDREWRDGSGSRVAISAWLADRRKVALLAQVGVGTIDQALIAGLRRRHQSLRVHALSRGVLIVDEVHAYDDWMTEHLGNLIELQSQLGGSVVLCSATLPTSLRAELVGRFAPDGPQVCPEVPGAYPLVTVAGPQARRPHEHSVGTSERERTVRVRIRNTVEACVEHIQAVASEGGCVCWVRNSVDDAIEAYRVLESLLGAERVQLFHARFTAADRARIETEVLDRFGESSGPRERAGRVLVATQVVEQSLDLDFDAMVSDLAPIDLLIQRAGRLHRHVRARDGKRGHVGEREAPVLDVLSPAFEDAPASDWFSCHSPRSAFVYRDVGRLWLTLRALRASGSIVEPSGLRELIEAVYSVHSREDIPEGLRVASVEAEGERRAQRSLAQFAKIDWSRGYIQGDDTEWGMDELGVTRLGDPTRRVVLARLAAEGAPRPMSDDWRGSELSVRAHWLSAHSGASAEELHRRLPARYEHALVVSMREDGREWMAQVETDGEESTWRYGAMGLERETR